MDLRRRQTLLLALAGLATPAIAVAQTPDLAVGQAWSARDTTARVVIGRIETVGGVEVVSVSILELPAGQGLTGIAHLPFEKAALVASLQRLLATRVATDPRFEDGYQDWKRAKGGYFTISVAQAIALALQTVRRARLPAQSAPVT